MSYTYQVVIAWFSTIFVLLGIFLGAMHWEQKIDARLEEEEE